MGAGALAEACVAVQATAVPGNREEHGPVLAIPYLLDPGPSALERAQKWIVGAGDGHDGKVHGPRNRVHRAPADALTGSEEVRVRAYPLRRSSRLERHQAGHTERRDTMSDKGRDDLKQVAAKIKEEAGELLGDGEAAREGRREQTEGAAEAKRRGAHRAHRPLPRAAGRDDQGLHSCPVAVAAAQD